MKKLISLLSIAAVIFVAVRFGARQHHSIGLRENGEHYQEECQSEGCDVEEKQEMYGSYNSECLDESCSLEEVREISGSINSINPMLNDFRNRGWRVQNCHFWGGCVYSPGCISDSGDAAMGGLCNQSAINQFWHDFDFDKDDWDNGFGYEDPCNINLPLGRTFSALNVLDFFGTSKAENSSNWLPWFYAFSSNAIDELDARCDFGRACDGCVLATTVSGPIIDNYTVLKWPFFYSLDAPSRAGTIVHEARHADGKGHNCGSGCPRGGSCDSSWGYNGANTYQVLYLWWLYAEGRGIARPLRNMARNRANGILSSGFCNRPKNKDVFGPNTSNPEANFVIL